MTASLGPRGREPNESQHGKGPVASHDAAQFEQRARCAVSAWIFRAKMLQDSLCIMWCHWFASCRIFRAARVGHDFWEAFRCEEKHILARLVQLFVKHAGRRDQVSVSSLSRGSGFSTVFSTARGSTLMLPPACEPPCTACSTKDVAASSDECPKRQQRRRRW